MIKIRYDFLRIILYGCVFSIFFAIVLKDYSQYLMIAIISCVILFTYFDCKALVIYPDKLIVSYYFFIIPIFCINKVIFTKDDIDIRIQHISKSGWSLRMIPKDNTKNILSRLFFQFHFSMGNIDSDNDVKTIEKKIKDAGFFVTIFDGK